MSLQAVFAGSEVVPALREAALAVVQHDGRRDDAGGWSFAHFPVQCLNLSLLIGLQVLHLQQVSGKVPGFKNRLVTLMTKNLSNNSVQKVNTKTTF